MNVLQDIRKSTSFSAKMKTSVASMALINVIPTQRVPIRKARIYAHAIPVIVEMGFTVHVSLPNCILFLLLCKKSPRGSLLTMLTKVMKVGAK